MLSIKRKESYAGEMNRKNEMKFPAQRKSIEQQNKVKRNEQQYTFSNQNSKR